MVIQCPKLRSCSKFNHVVIMPKLLNLNNISMNFCCNSFWLVRFCLNSSNKGSVRRINIVSGHFARSGTTKWNWVELADCFWSGGRFVLGREITQRPQRHSVWWWDFQWAKIRLFCWMPILSLFDWFAELSNHRDGIGREWDLNVTDDSIFSWLLEAGSKDWWRNDVIILYETRMSHKCNEFR